MRPSGRDRWLAQPSGRSPRWMAVTGLRPGTELGLQAASRHPAKRWGVQSSSARQMPFAVQALQIGRASTNEPRGRA